MLRDMPPDLRQKAAEMLSKIEQTVYEAIKNCGTGAGGFQPGNTCAGGGSSSGSEVAFTNSRVDGGGADSKGKWGFSDAEHSRREFNFEASGVSGKIISKSDYRTEFSSVPVTELSFILHSNSDETAAVLASAIVSHAKNVDSPLYFMSIEGKETDLFDNVAGVVSKRLGSSYSVASFKDTGGYTHFFVDQERKGSEASVISDVASYVKDRQDKHEEDVFIKWKNCGTGAGGFQPGNTCASGGGDGSSGSSGFSGKPANPDGKDTLEQYRNADKTWTKERQELHDHIIEHAYGSAKPVDKPVAYLMGGGPASGKSFAVKAGMIQLPENLVTIDSDEIKKSLPEYNKMVAAKDAKAAPFVHEESSYLAKQILAGATKGSYNVMLDGTGDSGIDSLASKVEQMRASGAKVVANYMTVDTKTALERNVARAAKTGRLPPESFVRAAHATISRIVPQAIERGLFDEFKLIDTNSKEPKVVATAVGRDLKIHDQALWDRFLAKGSENEGYND